MERLDQTREISDKELYEQIDELILQENRTWKKSLGERERLRRELYNSVRKLDILQELLEDETITEVMVNGTDGIFLERGGEIFRWEKHFQDRGQIEDVVQQIAGGCDRIVNESIPIGDARLEDGARVNLVLPPVALNGPIITIRRFPRRAITMRELTDWGSISQEAADLLKQLVYAGYNLFISGGTGSGKTTADCRAKRTPVPYSADSLRHN